ncbi:hypothetical protein NQZ68_012922 [Dissostichus eleginoides]|nr:hypothetical protein NQZ68_012922 [Dissostichus eleginoides]
MEHGGKEKDRAGKKRVGDQKGALCLSPPDKRPLDKCGQAGEEPSFSRDGVQDSDKDGALLGEMGERSKGPQAEKLSQQQLGGGDMDRAPVPILAQEFHMITGLTGEGHQLFRPTTLWCVII